MSDVNRPRRPKATLRERRRMAQVNAAFDQLRRAVPRGHMTDYQRLSKIATLRLAIQYIRAMTARLMVPPQHRRCGNIVHSPPMTFATNAIIDRHHGNTMGDDWWLVGDQPRFDPTMISDSTGASGVNQFGHQQRFVTARLGRREKYQRSIDDLSGHSLDGDYTTGAWLYEEKVDDDGKDNNRNVDLAVNNDFDTVDDTGNFTRQLKHSRQQVTFSPEMSPLDVHQNVYDSF